MRSIRRRCFVRAVILVIQSSGLACASPVRADSAGVFPYAIEKSVLDNGLTVLSVRFDSPGIIAYHTVVRAGSRNEVEDGRSGFAHFFEHMMFRGTAAYPPERYNDVLKSLGADFNAYTKEDWTCYHMTIPSTALATAVQMEADRFQNLKYEEPAFQKEARAVLGEYNKNASSPFLKLSEAMQGAAYLTHTYKHTTIGFLADIEDMPNQYAYSKIFFDRWYRPENCTIIVTGDVNHGELVDLVKRYYGGWKRGGTQVQIPLEPPQSQPRSARLYWPLPTLPTLYLGYHIPAASLPNVETAALGALAEAVFGEASPLYTELVLEKQTAVTILAEAEQMRDPGLFTIAVRVRRPEDLALVRERIAQALADAARTPIDAARLTAIKSHLRYAFASSLRTADALAEALVEAEAISGRPESINELYAAYDRLTPDDLTRVAARYFQPRNETVITLETEAKKEGSGASPTRKGRS
jgi:zinc protease